LATPHIVEQVMEEFAERVGRRYQLFSYSGHPEAERVIILMGSGCETAEETVNALVQQGEKVGVVKVRLFRPFSAEHLIRALPPTVTRIAVLDRTKEPGSAGEPLYQDVVTAINQFAVDGHLATLPLVVGGRYGLASKEFTPAMVKGVFDHLKAERPRHNFTVGIVDDVTHTSIPYDPTFSTEARDGVINAIFWGLGSDGTVSANKNSIKIIGEQTPNYAQGYFVYDSKKSGSVTVSHLRFGPHPIRAPYLIGSADFVACSQFHFVGRIDVLGYARRGATVLLNSPYGVDGTWSRLPREWQAELLRKKIRLFVIDATRVAQRAGMGRRTNTVLQTCFFALSGVLPREEAIAEIKRTIKKTYGRKGDAVVQMNFAAVDAALAGLDEVSIPTEVDPDALATVPPRFDGASDFVKRVTAKLIAGEGDLLPVSALPVDGGWPTGTACYEKRNIAIEIPAWDPNICIQCNKCVLVCPHAAIRAKYYDPAEDAPDTFLSAAFRSQEYPGKRYTV